MRLVAAAAAVGFPRSPLTFASRRFKKVRRFDEVHFRITFKLIKTQLQRVSEPYSETAQQLYVRCRDFYYYILLRRSKAWKRAGEFEFCILKTTRRETQKPFGSSISSWSEETFANLTASRTEAAALIVASVVEHNNYWIVGLRLQTIKQVRRARQAFFLVGTF